MPIPKLSKGYSIRGANMGRRTIRPPEGEPVGRVRLYHEPLDSGGYDSGGAYWGGPNNLYHCTGLDGDLDWFLRATTRKDAKQKVLEDYPDATFYR